MMSEDKQKSTPAKFLEDVAKKYANCPEGAYVFLVVDNRQGNFASECNTNDMIWALGILKLLEINAANTVKAINNSEAAQFINSPVNFPNKVN